ncbi:hypothetical protein K432DRAFT_297280, partial [Lepidopterella palustris CBS 459.81]
KKTYSSRDSPLVTHANTNLPICSLNIGERTGPVVFCNLWPYVKEVFNCYDYKLEVKADVSCSIRVFEISSARAAKIYSKRWINREWEQQSTVRSYFMTFV